MRIALPKGRLLPNLLDYLEERGIAFDFAGDRDYRPRCSVEGVETKLIKARSVPQMVAFGNFHVGFTCTDAVVEGGYGNVIVVRETGLDPVRMVVAVHESMKDVLARPSERTLVIATEYPRIAARWAIGRGLPHDAIDTTGSSEAYPPEDADIVVDVCGSGATLEANGLVIVETLFESSTCALTTRPALEDPTHGEAVRRFIARL